MRPKDSTNPPDPLLESALRDWEVKQPLPPRFEQQVWCRIQRAEAEVPSAIGSLVWLWIAHVFTRRSVAVSYLAILLACGLLAGYWQARAEKERSAESLSARYVQMVDPYQSRH